MAQIWLVEMTVYDSTLGSTRTLRVCSGKGFTTRPADTPANTWYDPRLKQPINIVRSIASPGATSGQSRVALGDVLVSNPDAALDGWIDYAFDGRAIVIRSGDEAAAYPGGFTTEFVGTMDYPDFSTAFITIKLREYQREMDAPVQIARYGGTNALPAGVDGVVGDLKGKSRPLLYGRVTNVPPPNVNTSQLIYELSSAAVSTCTAVYDRGIALTVGATYTNMADMIANAPAASTFRFLNTATGSYIRLGSSPAGTVTADAEQASGTPATETAAQIFSQLLTRAGTNLGNPSRYTMHAGDVAALDALDASVIGLFVGAELTFLAAMDQVAGSVGAWWGGNHSGEFRIQRLVAPGGTPAYTFTANDIVPPLERLSTRDEDRGVPVYQVTCRYAKNWTVQTDLAAGVSDARRAVVAQEWREATSKDTRVQTKYLLATTIVADTLYATEAGALAEAFRRQSLRALQRHRFDITVQYTAATAALDLGDIVGLSHTRYSLSLGGSDTGQLFTIIAVTPDAAARRIMFTLWGASLTVQNRLFEDGVTRLFEDGTYRLTEF